ncbi:MAG: glutamate--tRNA ligase [Candidatus Nealsonbacteria bacterium]
MKQTDFKFKQIRVRMAPSPTGHLHVGTARAALFNYLFAKHEGGEFILRIEDTDLERSDPKFEKDIIENLKWLGIEWDEFYRQSERTETYTNYLDRLLQENKLYRCFCTQEELEDERQEELSRGASPKYNGKCRALTEKQIKENLAQGKPSILRFKTPEKKIVFHDLIRSKIEFDTTLIGDFAIAKDLATPLYNFAVVVDDFEMQISHVIRGEDHIPNTPKQILIQEALNFPQPKYAHLPLILGPDKSKLSKRHAATSVADYRKMGYMPEAMVNFMAFLGWNPGTEREIFTLPSLVKEFSLDKVQKSGAVFNIKKLDSLNGFYLRQKTIDKLADLCQLYLPQTPKNNLKKIVALYHERLKNLSEITALTDYFFRDKLDYKKSLLNWKDMTQVEINQSLDTAQEMLSKISKASWTKDNLEKLLLAEAGRMGDRGRLLWPLRAALTGQQASAGPIDVAFVLGKEKTLQRIKEAKELK